MAKKTAKKAAKPAKQKAAKPAAKAAKAAKAKAKPAAAEPADKGAAKVPAKGVLIRLKRPADKEKKAVAEEPAPNRSFNEKSKGEKPITLHHRKPTKSELAELKDLLMRRRTQLIGDVKGLEAEAFSDETQVVSTNHLADSSFEQYEQEFTLSMIENETEELREIGRALDKLDEGRYGVCESCGIDISIERLHAMPYTRICIHCRNRFEQEGGGKEFGVVEERRV